MCGIIGYVGQGESVRMVFDALKKLEYRGYDSAGIVALHNHAFHIEKESGKLDRLEPHLARLPAKAPIAMGHTRWATHGKPTKENAHPHQSELATIVHNGIIENYKELKSALQAKGARFASETDSEVVGHMITMELQQGHAPKQAILNVVKQLDGAFALGIILKNEPDHIYIAKQGSPLVIAMGKGENYFGSDATPFAGLTDQVIFLNDGECGRIDAKGYEVWDFEGKTVHHRPTMLDWFVGSPEKQGYKHFMLKEIHEQPAVIANTIGRLIDRTTHTFNYAEMGLDKLQIDRIENIHIVACGTAYLSGLVSRYFIEPLLGIPVNVELASEFRYRKPVIGRNSLVMAISQSGETADTLACIKHARETGCQTFSVCNVRFASIPRECHGTLYMEAGQEIGVASTKAFTSQVLNLYLLGLALATKLGKCTPATLEEKLTELNALPLNVSQAINAEDHIKELANKYYEYPNFLYIGRGPSFAIAMEGALKLKEISYIHAEGYASGELKHGPIALVDRHMPVVSIVPQDEFYQKTLSNVEEVCARQGVVIGIGDRHDEKLKHLCTDFIPCPQTPTSGLQAILSTISVQFLAYYIAIQRGTDVDQPRNLAKSVTVE